MAQVKHLLIFLQIVQNVFIMSPIIIGLSGNNFQFLKINIIKEANLIFSWLDGSVVPHLSHCVFSCL